MEGDFLNKIWDFFSNERISLTPKITIPLFLIIIVLITTRDNHYYPK